MRGYTVPSIPDNVDLETLKLWIAEQLQLVSEALPRGDLLRLEIRRAAPERPRNGMLVYADGTEWNPGSGEGFYGYESGSWVKL